MKKAFFAFLLPILLLQGISSSAESLGEFILHHVQNSYEWHPIPGGPSIHLPTGWVIGGVDMSISLHVLMMFIALILLFLVMNLAARRKGDVPTSKFGHAIEALVLYVRDEVLVPTLGKKDAPAWTPFFLTVFFFLLTLNLLGLIPGMATTTSNINFTATMAILIFLVFNISGMMHNGPVHYFMNLVPKGVPAFVVPVIFPIEVLGLFTKTFALAIRLFANMSAGHIIIFSLLGLIAVFKSLLAAPPFLGFTLFIYLIEILVAFIQAYIFTLLSALFVGGAIHQEH